MTLIESIIARAKSNRQRIVLPESLEERTLTAADKALADEIADIILIGNPDEIFWNLPDIQSYPNSRQILIWLLSIPVL